METRSNIGRAGMSLASAMAVSGSAGLAFRRAGWIGEALRWIRKNHAFWEISSTPGSWRIIKHDDLDLDDFEARDYTTLPVGCEGSAPPCDCESPSFGSSGSGGSVSSSVDSGEWNPNAAFGVSCGQDAPPPCDCRPNDPGFGVPLIHSIDVDYFSASIASAKEPGGGCIPPGLVWAPRIDFTWRPPDPSPGGKWVALLIREREIIARKVIGEDVPPLDSGYYGGVDSGRIDGPDYDRSSLQLASLQFRMTVQIINLNTGITARLDQSVTLTPLCVGSGSGSA